MHQYRPAITGRKPPNRASGGTENGDSSGTSIRASSHHPGRLLVMLCLLVGLTGWFPASAHAERLNFLRYLPAQGISQSQVNSILQDQEGFIWLGTLNGGLNRFDGQAFRTYRWPDGLASAHVRVLLEVDRQLYVGTRHGLFRREQNRFNPIASQAAHALDIYGLAVTPAGQIMVATEVGLYRIHQERLEPDPRGRLLPEGAVFDVIAGPKGELWVYGSSWLGVLEGETFTPIPLPQGMDLRTLILDQEGGAWVGTRKGLYRATGNSVVEGPRNHPMLSQAITCLYIDRGRTLWVGTRKGAVGLKDRIVRVMAPETGFPSVQVRAIYEDREGSLFFGTDGEGLIQLPPQPFVTFTLPGLNEYAPVATVLDRAGRRWVATLGQGLWYLERDRAFLVDEAAGLTSPDCTSMLLNPDGTLWVGTNSGLFEVSSGGSVPRAKQLWAVNNAPVNALLADEGRRYVSTEEGLWVLEGKRWRSIGTDQGLPSSDLFGLRRSRDGHLWVGTSNEGAFRWDPATGKVLEHIRLEDGLPSRTVFSILEHTDGSTYFGTDQGLVHRTAKGLKVITERDGLPDDTINFITQDPTSSLLWVGTNRGIAALVDGEWRVYTHRQGLPNDETNTNAAVWDRDGRLWAGTSHGYAILTASPPPINPVPPIVHIEGAFQSGQPLDLSATPTFEHLQNRLRFSFVGLSFTDPSKVRYRYRLAGLEDAWIETSQREARYPSLPPGNYVFEVTAGNNDDRWTTQPVQFAFSILPPVWETWWFRTLQVLLIFLSGVFVYGLRAAHLVRQKRKLERLVTERTQELQEEKEKSERLLLNILPAPIAEELKENGVATTRLYPDATILFTDFQDFTRMCSTISPEQLVGELNEVFAAFDDICKAHRLEKLKTIGDAFMAAGGLPVENDTHPLDAVEAAIEMQEYLEMRSEDPDKMPFKLRIGLHTGPVVAGVIGKWKFAYDIWGDAVNTAARMESSGAAGEINLSRSTYDRIRLRFICEARGQVLAKGKGALEMFFIRSRRNAA